MKTKFEILRYVSGSFLCDFIPDDWETLTKEEQNEFIEENTVQWLEFTPPEDVRELITDEANRLMEFIDGS